MADKFLTQVGTGSPMGVTTPAFIGQQYIDTNSGAVYIAVGTGNNQWAYLGSGNSSNNFNPYSISSLQSWVDITDYSTLTFNGNYVTRIGNKVTTSGSFTINSGSVYPTYVQSYLNGKSALLFVPATQGMLQSGAVLNVARTIFVVMQINSYNDAYFISSTNCSLWSENDSGGSLNVRDDDSVGKIGFFSPKPIIVCAQCPGASIATRGCVNNGGWTYCSTVAGTGAGSTIQIGDDVGMGIGELLVYNAALNDTQISQVFAYLNSKWAVY